MKQRLEQFLAAENLTKAQFADMIGVARAAISHIMAGRNNPGYDFISNTMDTFPALNIEWLLKGRGKMYKNQDAPVLETENSLFLNSQEDIESEIMAETPATEQVKPQIVVQGAKVKKILVFYNDGTYQEFC